MSFGELLFFGSLVALANVGGGLLLARPGTFQRSRQFLSYLVALGAGFMLAAIFIEIVPEVVVLWTKSGAEGKEAGHGVLGAMTLLLAGYLLIHFSNTRLPRTFTSARRRTRRRSCALPPPTRPSGGSRFTRFSTGLRSLRRSWWTGRSGCWSSWPCCYTKCLKGLRPRQSFWRRDARRGGP